MPVPVVLISLVLGAVALVEGIRIIAGFRWTARLNQALHELRRPLQLISLSIGGSSPDLRGARACMEQARVALEDLDAAINRRPAAPRIVRIAVDEVASALEDRWHLAGVEVSAGDPGRVIDADPARLGAALDNLVANAVEHGSGRVSVRGLTAPGSVRFEVLDGGPAAGPPADSRRDRRRRGHGLRVASELAASHGGTVIQPRSMRDGGTMAAISLPAPAPARAADSG